MTRIDLALFIIISVLLALLFVVLSIQKGQQRIETYLNESDIEITPYSL